jgi:hypothetical protein
MLAFGAFFSGVYVPASDLMSRSLRCEDQYEKWFDTYLLALSNLTHPVLGAFVQLPL